MPEDKILSAIAEVTRKVDDLSAKVGEHDKKLRWVTSIAMVVVGAVGGPNAVKLITSGTV